MNRAIGQQLVINNIIMGTISNIYNEGFITFVVINDDYEIPIIDYVEVIDLSQTHQQRIPNLKTPYIRARVL